MQSIRLRQGYAGQGLVYLAQSSRSGHVFLRYFALHLTVKALIMEIINYLIQKNLNSFFRLFSKLLIL